MQHEQLSFFDLIYPEFKVPKNKRCRVIELFGGYGSQLLEMKYIEKQLGYEQGQMVEQWKLCEWAYKSIQAYKDLHFTDDDTDYSEGMSLSKIIDYLEFKGISRDYSKPMTRSEISRMKESEIRTIYNNIIATHDLVDITRVHACDLEIEDTDKYQYIITYSFPCQDLSASGLRRGMSKEDYKKGKYKDGGVIRSGLLWEVERILDELKASGVKEMPILLMENVTAVHGTRSIEDWKNWITKLESLGYSNFVEDINAKDYGIPQHRDRTFCLSISGEWNYHFLKKEKLKICLNDIREHNVDKKYYITKKQIKDIKNWKAYKKPLEILEHTENTQISPTLTTRSGDYNAGMILVRDEVNDRREIEMSGIGGGNSLP